MPEVYTMRSDGSHERHLANGSYVSFPAFSPNGRKVLFRRRGSDSLFTIRANGTRLRRIRHTSRSFEGSFAPGGKRIVFTGWPRKDADRTFLYTVRTDGSHRKRISHSQNANDPQFSPNGRWIVFHCSGLGHLVVGHICLIRPNGTHRRPLTEALVDYAPDFSPGGRRIVFIRETPATTDEPRKTGIYTIRKDGTHLRRVYEATDEKIEDPVFSPSGRRIAFSRRKIAFGRAWDYRRIYTIWPDGSHLRRLSQGPGGHEDLSWGVRR